MEQKRWLDQIREKTQKLISLESVDTMDNTVGNMGTVHFSSPHTSKIDHDGDV